MPGKRVHEDPLWGHWTFPAEDRRARDLLSFMKVMARLGPEEMWIEMTSRGEAVTIWTPPGATYGTPEQQPLIDELFERLFGPRASAMHDLFEQFDENLPPGRYYHLEWWATYCDHAGRGIGSALLRENLAQVDAQHLPCYLESTNPANLSRYEALGFRPVGASRHRAGRR